MKLSMKALFLASTILGGMTIAGHAADLGGRRPVVAPPAAPACGTSGVVGAYGIVGGYDGYYEGNAGGLGIAGKVNFCDVLGGLGLQADGFGEGVRYSGDMDGYFTGQVGTELHLYTRNSGFAFGILGGLSMAQNNYFSGDPGVLGNIGVEGQLYIGNLTLAAQGVYWNNFSADSSNGGTVDNAYEASLEARYFLNPNFRIGGIVGYHHNHDAYADYDWKGLFYGVDAEYKFGTSPVSLFASLVRFDGDIEGDDQNSTSFKIGLNVHFNQPTLLSVDRTGASFRTPTFDSVLFGPNSYYR